MIEILKQTVASTLDLFKSRSGNYLNFSFLFYILFSVITSLAAIAYFYLLDFFYDINFGQESSLVDLLLFSKGTGYLTQYITGLFFISLGLYAVYITNIPAEKDPSIDSFFSSLTKKNIMDFFSVVFVYTLIALLFYGGILKTELVPDNSEEGILGSIDDFGESVRESRDFKFYQWVDSLFSLVLVFIPYIGALYIVASHVNGTTLKSFFKEYKKNIFAILIILFSLNTIINTGIQHFKYYIVSIKDIAITEPISSAVLGFIISSVSYSYFLLMIAGVLLYTVLYSHSKPTIEENQVVNNNS
jgi:hypothetical protein